MDKLQLINLPLLSHFKDKIDELLAKKVNKTDIATTEQLGLIKPDNNTVFVDENGVLSSVGGTGGSGTNNYENLINKPRINGTELIGDVTLEIPTKVSELDNDSGYLTEIPEQSYALSDLTDVQLTSLSDGQGLFYNEELQKWVNGDVMSSGGSSGSGTLKPWIYDTENETIIGVYDGKPLYRKVYYVENQIIQSNEIVIDIDVHSEVEKYVNVSSSIFDSVNSAWMLLPFRHPNYPIELYVDMTSVHLNFNYAYTPYDRITKIYIVIEYTKTTDAEGSGNGLTPSNGGSSPSLNYSTEEQVVSKWIDGKPIYQKTVHYLNTQSLFYDYVTIVEITNIDKPIKLEFVVKRGTGENIIYMTGNGSIVPESNLDYGVRARILAKNLQYRIDTYGTEISDMWFTIQYTKTTDITT